MSTPILNLIIQLVAGAVGGNVAGAFLKQFNLGPVGNSIAGLVGGGLGGQLLNMVLGSGAATGGGLDLGSIVTQIVGGGVGGGIVMVIVGLLRQAMGGQSAS